MIEIKDYKFINSIYNDYNKSQTAQLKKIYDLENIYLLSKFYSYHYQRGKKRKLNIPFSIFGFIKILTIKFIRISLSAVTYSMIFSPLLLINSETKNHSMSSQFPDTGFYVTGEFISNVKNTQQADEKDILPPSAPTNVKIQVVN
ncbi:MAG: hypothetical protein GF329_18875 [Candidatus Lokiarchaeota archaeon]|nr:hypothetical protein [Candidatus Lokiarchaeota archaeon]